MADAPPTFSESWFRVASQRLSLRPNVNVRRQTFRGQRWMVLENPLTNQFFRMHPVSYEFVARLRPERTVEEVWKECLERSPDEAPGQEAVIQILSQLYHAGLLQYSLASDSAQLFKRYERVRQREIRSQFLNIMFLRVPLLDPDRFLSAAQPLTRLILSPLGALIWLIVVGLGIKVAIEHLPELKDQTQGVLAPDNLLLLYLGTVLVKTLHEFGHAFFCRRYGGEVHVMGVMFMIFTPMPYVDATSSWGFRSRLHRMLVGAGGMIFELFVAALASFVWLKTGTGIVHSLAYNMMLVASVSTLVFNLNPLMRFDGYYILSDLLEIPNLNQRATQLLRFWAERYLLGVKKAESPAHSPREAVWLAVFGLTSSVYRIIVFGGILLFIADRFLLLGILMSLACAIAWVATPTIGLIRYLASSPRLERCRPRAVAVVSGAVLCLALILQFVPFPSHFRAPGVLRSPEESEVHNDAAGWLEEIRIPPGATVAQGDALLRLSNPELELNLRAARASRVEVESEYRRAMQLQTADLRPLASRLETVTHLIERLERDQAALVVRARRSGTWIAPHVREFQRRWLTRGSELGFILDPALYQFVATVAQEDADRLFSRPLTQAEVRLRGEAGRVVGVSAMKVIPAEHRNLPSAALGWAGGGQVAVSGEDPEGRRASEPFFEVRADLLPKAPASLLEGRSGEIRFELPAEPLLPRWVRRLRQLLQKRYQL